MSLTVLTPRMVCRAAPQFLTTCVLGSFLCLSQGVYLSAHAAKPDKASSSRADVSALPDTKAASQGASQSPTNENLALDQQLKELDAEAFSPTSSDRCPGNNPTDLLM